LQYEAGDFFGRGVIINFPQDKPCRNNVKLCHVQAVAVTTMFSLLICVVMHVAVDNLKPSTFVMATQK
jgi:hypothetical protein